MSHYPLRKLYFYLTEGCNLACRHCWIAPRYDPDARFPVLDPALFEAVLHEAGPLGLRGVKLTGGEPTLHPQFPAFLEIVRREGLKLTVETNGLLITPGVAAGIARCTLRPALRSAIRPALRRAHPLPWFPPDRAKDPPPAA